jgi:ferric-dicitrate binding protein FerR (iron transport regulator)
VTERRRDGDGEPAPAQALEPLLDLARSQLTGAEPRRGAASLATVEQLMQRQGRRRHRQALWRNGALVFASVALLAWQGLKLVASPLEMEVVAGELSADGQLSPSATTTTVRFSDGTELVVQPAASAEVASIDPHGADIRLRRGQLRLDVAKREGADWNVLAGAYRVHVTGTSFSVALAESGERLDVEMFSGTVRVSGPLIERELEVTRAQRLRIDQKHGRVAIEPAGSASTARASLDEPPADAAPPEVQAPEAALPPIETPAREAPPTHAHRSRRAEASWSSLVSAGQFARVLDAAQVRGFDAVYQRAPLADLEALADAARYAQRASVARDALLAVRARFAKTKAAKQAAFLLGRLVEDESATSALEWYDRYLAEEPRGVHASQALGRRMLILYRKGETDQAASTAREYLVRFPNGPHAASARKIVTGP